MSDQNEIVEDIDELKSNQNHAADGWKYSIQRMDLLIISIGGAGVYVTLETLKEAFLSKSGFKLDNIWAIKVTGALFVLTIIVNFISQWTGMQANKYEMFRCSEKLAKDSRPSEASRFECLSRIYSNWTNGLNLASMLMMFAGLAILVIYFLVMF